MTLKDVLKRIEKLELEQKQSVCSHSCGAITILTKHHRDCPNHKITSACRYCGKEIMILVSDDNFDDAVHTLYSEIEKRAKEIK